MFLAMTQRHDSENELITVGSDGHLITWDCDEDVVGDIVEAGTLLPLLPPACRARRSANSSQAALLARNV